MGRNLAERIQFELTSNYGDSSNSWSRLDWMCETIGTFNLPKEDLLQYLKTHEKELNIHLTPLAAEYSYFGSDTWNLGYFKPEYYNPEGY